MFDVKMALSEPKTYRAHAAQHKSAHGDWLTNVLIFLSSPWLFQPSRR